MIEVEKKFQPTKEQIESLLKGAEFLWEKVIHDIYYDYSDYRLFKNQIRLRNRDNSFELKIKKDALASLELENENDIKEYFETDDLKEFIKKNLIIIVDYRTTRKRYKRGEFIIDLDEMSFGYSLCEIEILVEKEEQIEEAREKILNLVKEYDFELKKLPAKGSEYLRLFKPKIYKIIGEIEE
jgi:adenylate cyclase class IV